MAPMALRKVWLVTPNPIRCPPRHALRPRDLSQTQTPGYHWQADRLPGVPMPEPPADESAEDARTGPASGGP